VARADFHRAAKRITQRLVLAVAMLTAGGPPGDSRPDVARAAGITVNSLVDAAVTDGLCTLREAMFNAQADGAPHPDCASGAGADAISFSVGGVITLTAPLATISASGGPLVVDGVGQALTVSGADSVRPFLVGAGATVTLARFTVTNGADPAAGGAVLNGGALTLNGMTFANNQASAGAGGAVVNLHGATLTIDNSSFEGNFAQLDGGAILNGVGAQPGAPATLSATNSTFSGNTVGGNPLPWGNGGALVNQGAATFTTTLFEANHASHDGGAIYNRGPLTLTGSTLRANTVLDSGAA